MKKMGRFFVPGIKIVFFVFLLVVSVQTGCKEGDIFQDEDCRCTEEFVIQSIKVIDTAGNPVTDAEVRSIMNYNTLELAVQPYHDADNGRYCIMTDDYVEYLELESVWIIVGIRRPGTNWMVVNYYFNTDQCKCHINLLRGELTVVFN